MNDHSGPHKSGERIAKVIARSGLGSRREAEGWITAGRVAVNGEVVRSPARDVTDRDRITVDGEPLPARERTRLFLYHKPRGLLTTRFDPQGRPTIFEKLPPDLPRLISVGRLDFNTEGLLLLTNDGALARVLELPATGWLRRYRVRAHGAVSQQKLDGLRRGITISGIHYGAIEAALDRVQGSNLWLTLAIREGKNREVRNVLSHLGLTVTRLIRVSFGPFQLGELEPGEVEEVRTRTLREQLGDKLIALADADFAAPVAQRLPSARHDDTRNKPPSKSIAPKTKDRKAPAHSWRAPSGHESKQLRRTFHGARRDAKRQEKPVGEARVATTTDRKGRAVAIERYGTPRPEETQRPPDKFRRAGRRRAPDRAFGPRPRHPRGR